VQLARAEDQWALGVGNEGPVLPAELQEHLFDPMVSLRQSESGGVHLGLGLHIVRLIVDFHRGRVRADNLPEGDGVCVTMSFPAINPGT
jgi:nitrogen-specific signal transduction histidine kinase